MSELEFESSEFFNDGKDNPAVVGGRELSIDDILGGSLFENVLHTIHGGKNNYADDKYTKENDDDNYSENNYSDSDTDVKSLNLSSDESELDKLDGGGGDDNNNYSDSDTDVKSLNLSSDESELDKLDRDDDDGFINNDNQTNDYVNVVQTATIDYDDDDMPYAESSTITTSNVNSERQLEILDAADTKNSNTKNPVDFTKFNNKIMNYNDEAYGSGNDSDKSNKSNNSNDDIDNDMIFGEFINNDEQLEFVNNNIDDEQLDDDEDSVRGGSNSNNFSSLAKAIAERYLK